MLAFYSKFNRSCNFSLFSFRTNVASVGSADKRLKTQKSIAMYRRTFHYRLNNVQTLLNRRFLIRNEACFGIEIYRCIHDYTLITFARTFILILKVHKESEQTFVWPCTMLLYLYQAHIGICSASIPSFSTTVFGG